MYSVREYVEMHLIYGECQCNAREAARVYAARYPGREVPSRNVFLRLHERMLETGQILPVNNINGGPERYIRNVDNEERILELIEEDPTTSTRRIASRLGIGKSSVNRVLLAYGFHDFKYTRVQKLQPEDYPRRVEFCEWIVRKNEEDENFTKNVLWTDESFFTQDGCFNSHNWHYYDIENPHRTWQRNSQHRWKFNIWAGITNDQIIGPYLLPDRLNVSTFSILCIRPRGGWRECFGAP